MLKRKSSKEVQLDLLLANFAGELVEVILNKDVTQTMSADTGEGVITESLTSGLRVVGYLTDLDDSFLYLGYEENSIHQAINRDFIVHIAQYEEEIIEQMMDGVKAPGEFN